MGGGVVVGGVVDETTEVVDEDGVDPVAVVDIGGVKCEETNKLRSVGLTCGEGPNPCAKASGAGGLPAPPVRCVCHGEDVGVVGGVVEAPCPSGRGPWP